ncbi:hypothetical protein HIM_02133 [Hirsutella minnesotensis 3608]|nr:hypothetical protein HIM_02133 [Hirsutella minnesotensis 3608]
MAFNANEIEFPEPSVDAPTHLRRRKSLPSEKGGSYVKALTTHYIGISCASNDDGTAVLAFAIRDAIYLIDFCVEEVSKWDNNQPSDDNRDQLADRIIAIIKSYQYENLSKFIGAGVPSEVASVSPTLCSRLWLELDIIPLVLDTKSNGKEDFWDVVHVDEQADSMARRCIVHFGPSMVPILQVGWHGAVDVAAGFRAQLCSARDYEQSCSGASWETLTFFADRLRASKTKIAYFSSTPQGGGVALMRHSLVRFSRLLGVDVSWYVPKPRRGVFRITKNIHNILQGVSPAEQRIPKEDKEALIDWITDNAKRYWFAEGGPLRPSSEGGADVIIVDDPQMVGLVPLIKDSSKNRPVLFRSHIQVRRDLIRDPKSSQADVWDFIWENIRQSDLFISHPVPDFVPDDVPPEKTVYHPATSDWLDGLNKDLNEWNTGYYRHMYNVQCHKEGMTELDWPARNYIVQIARFDPAKGIPTVLDSYGEFRRRLNAQGVQDPPQLVICGNGSVDDPDASMIFEQTLVYLETRYPELQNDVSVMRLDPNDQLLNCLISNAYVVLQLSTREGFEVKVSEALHAGRPVIATLAGGIPLQIKDKVNGFLVQPGDYKAVAGHLVDLFTDKDLHGRMSQAARQGVSDEVSTVGNAIGWYYLAFKWAVDDLKARPKGMKRWVADLAREAAGKPYSSDENRLPRSLT